jgi:hypothetical protein
MLCSTVVMTTFSKGSAKLSRHVGPSHVRRQRPCQARVVVHRCRVRIVRAVRRPDCPAQAVPCGHAQLTGTRAAVTIMWSYER